MSTIISVIIYAIAVWAFMYLAQLVLDMTGISANWSRQTNLIISIGVGAATTWLVRGFLDDKIIAPLTAAIAG